MHLEHVYSVSYENGVSRVLTVSSRFLIRVQFASFFNEKEVDSFLYALETWVLGFLALKKFEYLFLIKQFLMKTICVIIFSRFYSPLVSVSSVAMNNKYSALIGSQFCDVTIWWRWMWRHHNHDVMIVIWRRSTWRHVVKCPSIATKLQTKLGLKLQRIFIRNLAPETSTQFLMKTAFSSTLSTVLSCFAVSYPSAICIWKWVLS